MGWPNSGYPAVIRARSPASARIAARVVSYDIVFDGNDQMLPSGIDPNPLATRPSPVRTEQFTFNTVARSTTWPPNLMGVRYLYSS